MIPLWRKFIMSSENNEITFVNTGTNLSSEGGYKISKTYSGSHQNTTDITFSQAEYRTEIVSTPKTRKQDEIFRINQKLKKTWL